MDSAHAASPEDIENGFLGSGYGALRGVWEGEMHGLVHQGAQPFLGLLAGLYFDPALV